MINSREELGALVKDKDIDLYPSGDRESATSSILETTNLPPNDSIDSIPTTSPVVENVPVAEAAWIPPNGGYGWVCVAAAFFINAHTWGMNSSYGVFLAHYLANNTFPGATRIDYAFIGGLSISSALFISPIATLCIRHLGTRTTLLIGVFFETTSFIAASFVNEIWQLFLSQGVCFGIGMGFLFVGSVGIIPQWFTTHRSLANGISAAGSGLGGLVYSLATGALIPKVGLAWTFRIMCFLAFGVNLVCSLLLKDRNSKVGASLAAFDVKLFRRKEFWALLGFGVFSMFGYVVLLFSIPNYANYIGLDSHQASVVGAVLNLGQALGRPPTGYFSDRVGRINMAGSLTVLSALFSLVIWTNAKSYGVSFIIARESKADAI
jgi:MFS family permease